MQQTLRFYLAFTACLLFSPHATMAQTLPVARIATATFDVQESNYAGLTADTNIRGTAVTYGTETVRTGAEIVVTNSTETHYVFYFVTYRNNDLKQRYNFRNISGTEAIRYFLLPKSMFESHTREFANLASPTFGAVSLPFKLRPGANVSTQFSLAATGGVKFAIGHRPHIGVSTVLGAGLTTITLNESNTDPAISETTQRSAVTIPMGVVFQWHRLQIGSFIGFDFIPDGNKDGWKDHGKVWWGLGVGFAVFSTEDAVTTPVTQTKQ